MTRVYLTVAEYSDLAGVPVSTVRTQLREGRLGGRRIGHGRGHWRVLASEVDKPKARRRRVKCTTQGGSA